MRLGTKLALLGMLLLGAFVGGAAVFLGMQEYARYRLVIETTNAIVEVLKYNIAEGKLAPLPNPVPRTEPPPATK